MKKYLLDTNICIYYMKGRYGLDEKLESRHMDALFISEITLAELKFGVAKSERSEKNRKVLNSFLTGVQTLPIFDVLDVYANEKARLQKAGRPVDDFDLLIGATAIANEMILVTNNLKHFTRLSGIQLEDWTTSEL